MYTVLLLLTDITSLIRVMPFYVYADMLRKLFRCQCSEKQETSRVTNMVRGREDDMQKKLSVKLQ
jgi:hypothetical protein